MSKYTRREFFKSIIPVSVGVVSFLGSDNSDKFLGLEKPVNSNLTREAESIEYIAYAIFQIDGREFYAPMYSMMYNNQSVISADLSWQEIE